ncbi:type II toxin-antitoxin system RelE/ParE family toxin [candidate division WOR-3 bacterium]|nr:type II toxin-antitoxin system RelE/ParE family toxin [candidate division WOR-3 bacterium]
MALKLVGLEDGPDTKVQVYALKQDERCQTLDFLKSLPRRALKRYRVVFRLIAAQGRAGREETSFKRLESDVWEIKEHSKNVRLFCFRHGTRLVVCTHGGPRPGGKAAYRREIDKVLALYRQCLEEGILK